MASRENSRTPISFIRSRLKSQQDRRLGQKIRALETPRCKHFKEFRHPDLRGEIIYCTRTKQSVLIKQDVLTSGCPNLGDTGRIFTQTYYTYVCTPHAHTVEPLYLDSKTSVLRTPFLYFCCLCSQEISLFGHFMCPQ